MGEIFNLNWATFTDIDNNQYPWLQHSKPYRDQRRGIMYDDDQLLRIRDNNQEAIGIPLAKPTVDTIVTHLLSDRAGVSVIPMGQADKEIAYFHQLVLDTYHERIRWSVTQKRIYEDMIGEGIGVAHVDRKNNLFGTTTKYCDYAKLRWDSHHDDLYWEDLDRIVYFDIMTVKQVMVKTGRPYDKKWIADQGVFDGKIMDDSAWQKCFGPQGRYPLLSSDSEEFRQVPYLEVQYLEHKNYEKLLFYDDDKTKIIGSLDIPVVEGENIKYEFQDDQFRNTYSYFYGKGGSKEYAQDIVDALAINRPNATQPLSVKRAVKTMSAGCADLGAETLPTDRVTFIPFINDLIGYPEGELRFTVPINKTINSTILLLVGSGRLQNNPATFYFGDSVDPKEYLAARRTAGGGMVKVKIANLSDPVAMKPYMEKTESVGPQYSELISKLVVFHDMVSGIYQSFQGNPAGAPETNSTTTQLNALAGQKLISKLKSNQFAKAEVARVEKDFIAEYADNNIMLRYKAVSEEMISNFGVKDGEPPKMFMARRVENASYNLEFPMNQTGMVNGKKTVMNDFRKTKNLVEYTITAAPDTHSTRERSAAEIRLLIQQAPELASVAAKWLGKLNDTPFLDEMMKEIDEIKNLQQSGAQKDEQIKRLTVLLDGAEKRAKTAEIDADKSGVVSAFADKFQKLLNKFTLVYDLSAKMVKMNESGAADEEEVKKTQEQINEVMVALEENLNAHDKLTDNKIEEDYPSVGVSESAPTEQQPTT